MKFALMIAFLIVRPAFAAEPVDQTLKPEPVSTGEITEVYRDMVVVQRKAKEKANKLLFFSYGSFDFSDGPTTMYGLNLDFGYALSDHWEVYANVVPAFVTQERDIVKRVGSLYFIDGDRARIQYLSPKSQYGVEVLWAPAYGKDSWGPYSIVRSDTFLKLGVGMIQYQSTSGGRLNLTIGKTFFLDPLFNFRLAAGGSYLQSIIDDQKKFYFVAIIEAGLIWYMF